MTTDGVLTEPQFTFGLPKRSLGGSTRRAALIALIPALKANTGEWAIVATSPGRHVAQGLASAIRNGCLGPAEHWEWAVRKNSANKHHELYLRHRGAQQKPQPRLPPAASRPTGLLAGGSVPPAVPAARPPAKAAPPADQSIALCTCGHGQRRHPDDGPCLLNCDCVEYQPASPGRA